MSKYLSKILLFEVYLYCYIEVSVKDTFMSKYLSKILLCRIIC